MSQDPKKEKITKPQKWSLVSWPPCSEDKSQHVSMDPRTSDNRKRGSQSRQDDVEVSADTSAGEHHLRFAGRCHNRGERVTAGKWERPSGSSLYNLQGRLPWWQLLWLQGASQPRVGVPEPCGSPTDTDSAFLFPSLVPCVFHCRKATGHEM
ncbi:hypothetical protein P7K49_013181 [Saguinus oedipus]|uniref:Uncharacterized protein n=1 Tax=Saguinus oedipus TaxID=9490 RepID=A0ABQ9VFF0_SAGOE|nr:hypothetical protein P7K49_013181 [Saguinus oedipus]